MIKILFNLFVVIFANAAMALTVSLEQALNKQDHVTISPVSFDGKFFSAGWPEAAGLCGALGFHRLVSFETENCVKETSLYHFSDYDLGGALALRYDTLCYKEYDQLSSVTCAK